MVMPLIPFEKTLADGSATEGGRRPSLVAAPSAASPELSDRLPAPRPPYLTSRAKPLTSRCSFPRAAPFAV